MPGACAHALLTRCFHLALLYCRFKQPLKLLNVFFHMHGALQHVHASRCRAVAHAAPATTTLHTTHSTDTTPGLLLFPRAHRNPCPPARPGVGKSIVSRHFRAGKELPPIGQLRAFDYAYQGATPIAPDTDTLQPGDELSLQCIFDSTGRSNWTRGGPATNDEMCMAWISYYPAQEDMG